MKRIMVKMCLLSAVLFIVGCVPVTLTFKQPGKPIDIEITKESSTLDAESGSVYSPTGKTLMFDVSSADIVEFVPGTDYVLIQSADTEKGFYPIFLYDFIKEETIWESMVSTNKFTYRLAGEDKDVLISSTKMSSRADGFTVAVDMANGDSLFAVSGELIELPFDGPKDNFVLLKRWADKNVEYFLWDVKTGEEHPLTSDMTEIKFVEKEFNRYESEDGYVFQGEKQLIAINFTASSIWSISYDTDMAVGHREEFGAQVLMHLTGMRLTEGLRFLTKLYSNVVIYDGKVIFSLNREMTGYDFATGKLDWKFPHEDFAYQSSLYLDNGMLYLISYGGARYISDRSFSRGKMYIENTGNPYVLEIDPADGKVTNRTRCSANAVFLDEIAIGDQHYMISKKSFWTYDKENGFKMYSMIDHMLDEQFMLVSLIMENTLVYNSETDDYMMLGVTDDFFYIEMDKGIFKIDAHNYEMVDFLQGYDVYRIMGEKETYVHVLKSKIYIEESKYNLCTFDVLDKEYRKMFTFKRSVSEEMNLLVTFRDRDIVRSWKGKELSIYPIYGKVKQE